jgi:hypothetical protein
MALVIVTTSFLAFILMVGFSVLAFIDALRQPSPAWEVAGRSKVAWALGIAMIPLPLAFVYWRLVRPTLAPPHR